MLPEGQGAKEGDSDRQISTSTSALEKGQIDKPI